jgi:5'-deoxynucleotidase YfbR-like HD superfamily hydrolase
MSWIQTFTGRRFLPRAPRPDDFDIRDVAHSLSLLCRFNGHCRVFYSVAEHSVRVSRVCPADAALWGLLHDLGEAYIGDLPRPIKPMFAAFEEVEARLLQTAAEAFNLPWPMPPSVRRADDVLLATEARDLMAEPPEPWGHREAPLPERITPLSPGDAERAFMERFEELRQGQGG